MEFFSLVEWSLTIYTIHAELGFEDSLFHLVTTGLDTIELQNIVSVSTRLPGIEEREYLY